MWAIICGALLTIATAGGAASGSPLRRKPCPTVLQRQGRRQAVLAELAPACYY